MLFQKPLNKPRKTSAVESALSSRTITEVYLGPIRGISRSTPFSGSWTFD